MLKLTTMQDASVYVMSRHIVALFRDQPDRTRIYTVEFSSDQWVKETPEQIMTMPEMIHELYTPMLVSPSPLGTMQDGDMPPLKFRPLTSASRAIEEPAQWHHNEETAKA